jgi:hypothetical protein
MPLCHRCLVAALARPRGHHSRREVQPAEHKDSLRRPTGERGSPPEDCEGCDGRSKAVCRTLCCGSELCATCAEACPFC